MPKTYWRKGQIVEWLISHAVPLPDGVINFNELTKASMIVLSKNYEIQERFIIDDLVRDCGKDVKLLWLPVARPELNNIELIWAFVKGKVSELNSVGGTKNVYNLTLECLKLVTPELWAGCIRESIKYEEKYWTRDRMIEIDLTDRPSNPNLVIDPNDEASESEDESSDEEFPDSDDSDMDFDS